VQARQRGQPIFTTTLSFTREGSGGVQTVRHAQGMPEGVEMPRGEDEEDAIDRGANSPFVSRRAGIVNESDLRAENKRTRQWIKARGRISDEGGHQAHLSALAYMSDSYFIGTVARVHKLWRYNTNEKAEDGKLGFEKRGITVEVIEKLKALDEDTLRRMEGMDEDVIDQLRSVEIEDGQIVGFRNARPEIGMMVSLDHTIYFHNPKAFRADEWMFTECESPWAGDGRGLVMQKMYSKDGTLVASCVQEVSFIDALDDER
jgi:acyl-CoA thioesterase 8